METLKNTPISEGLMCLSPFCDLNVFEIYSIIDLNLSTKLLTHFTVHEPPLSDNGSV